MRAFALSTNERVIKHRPPLWANLQRSVDAAFSAVRIERLCSGSRPTALSQL
jgi:hypothetical protein